MKVTHFILFVLCLSLYHCHALDKDEYFSEFYNHLYQGNYNELSTKADTAIEAWKKRVSRAEELSSSSIWRPFSHATKVSPQDEAAAKQGKEFCEKNLKYWLNRRQMIQELDTRIKIYETDLMNLLTSGDPLIKEFPCYTPYMDFSEITQEKLLLFKERTKSAWESRLKKLKESFFRSIKAERSQMMYENNGVLWGSVYAGLASLYRKADRLYNWEDSLTDPGPKFDEYLKIFDQFAHHYRELYKFFMIHMDAYGIDKRKDQLVVLLSIIEEANKEPE